MRRLLLLLPALTMTVALCAGSWGCYDPTYPQTYCCGLCGDGSTCLYTKIKDAEIWACVAHDSGKAAVDSAVDAGADAEADAGVDTGTDAGADALPADAAAEAMGD